MSTSPSEALAAVLDAATRLLADAHAAGDTKSVPKNALQELLAASVRTYAAHVEAGGPFPVFPRGAATATDVAIAACAMLEAVDIGIFELGMWQTIKTPAPVEQTP